MKNFNWDWNDKQDRYIMLATPLVLAVLISTAWVFIKDDF